MLPLEFHENGILIWNITANKLTTDQRVNGKKQVNVPLLAPAGKIKSRAENPLNFHLGLIIPVWNTDKTHFQIFTRR